MKKILILAMAIMVVGCEREVSNLNSDWLLYSCVDGVVYINNITHMGHGVLTPKFNADGTISTCLDEHHQ